MMNKDNQHIYRLDIHRCMYPYGVHESTSTTTTTSTYRYKFTVSTPYKRSSLKGLYLLCAVLCFGRYGEDSCYISIILHTHERAEPVEAFAVAWASIEALAFAHGYARRLSPQNPLLCYVW